MSNSESLTGILIVVVVLALAVMLAGGGSEQTPELTVEKVHETFPEWSIEDCERAVIHKVALLLDEDGLESSLEDVARSLVVSIDPLRVDAVEVSHATRQVRIGRFDQQMVVIGHQAVHVAKPSEALYGLA